jgi:hypothetical protein
MIVNIAIKHYALKRRHVFVGILLNGKATVGNAETGSCDTNDPVYIMKLRFTMD